MTPPLYDIHYLNSDVRQQKVLVKHADYERWKQMPEIDEDDKKVKDYFWKLKTGGAEWFTDQSPLFDAISSGILKCNGSHPVSITLHEPKPVTV